MRNGYPLVELHRHLDGNVRIQTIIDLARQHNLPLPAWEAEALKPHVRVVTPKPDLMSFIAKFELLRRVMVDYGAIRRIARENLEDAAREQIDYIELRFSPYFMAETHGLDPFGITETICETVEECGKSIPIHARLIVIMSRTYGPEKCRIELECALRYRNRGVVALDLAGDEANVSGRLFVEHFRKAREAGLHVIAHAGEAMGPESVYQAVLELGAERIGHAVSAVQDERLMDLLYQRRIGIESCPTSNVQTSTVDSYRNHPLPKFLERGLLATLNTDDPGISGIDLEHEYQVAQEKIGLTQSQLTALQQNAVEVAFLTQREHDQLSNLNLQHNKV